MTTYMGLMPTILFVLTMKVTLCAVGHFVYGLVFSLDFIYSLLIHFALWNYSSNASTTSICAGPCIQPDGTKQL